MEEWKNILEKYFVQPLKQHVEAYGFKFKLYKEGFSYSFPCDGMGQGEGAICDILALDAFYLGVWSEVSS